MELTILRGVKIYNPDDVDKKIASMQAEIDELTYNLQEDIQCLKEDKEEMQIESDGLIRENVQLAKRVVQQESEMATMQTEIDALKRENKRILDVIISERIPIHKQEKD